jgi:hypothetical protein
MDILIVSEKVAFYCLFLFLITHLEAGIRGKKS